MKVKSDPRHTSRELAIQILFEISFQEAGLPVERHNIEDLLSLYSPNQKYDKDLLNTILSQILKNKEKIDKLIRQYAPKHPLEKMDKINLNILRIAILEGFVTKVTPPKVTIDEAVE